ncbi:hypothetical protein SBOR_9315 [Sclerotinia borealis F-4128]|uniref:RNA polymerase-associated protein LEO1 n=1 Tax=Sclerotinia borealis (strain F-4128) TaxID=1432307 RepID=W9C6Z3_SCLBF|nr:hypothetical protein SBOR_9315 [Sclerotinia borealis F-4128]
MASNSEDEVMNHISDVEEDDDLFGDVPDEEPETAPPRILSDAELDSGDDSGRDDRVLDKEDEEESPAEDTRNARILEADIFRHPVPRPSDGEFHTLRLPNFFGIEPREYSPQTFEIPVSDHNVTTQSANFSARNVAESTIRYRKTDSGKLESNTNIYTWSDGSTTIAIGDQHYELQSKPLAPAKDSKYQEVLDSHHYMASPSVTSQILVFVGHMTNEFTVRPNKDIEDDALNTLKKNLTAATGLQGDEKKRPNMIVQMEDPELQKKRAETAEKERMRAQRRREAQLEKASQSTAGRRAGIGAGLTLDDLDGRSGRRGPRKPAGAKRPRRRPDYDSDDDLPRGRNREDEYDKEDDFLASSDEEPEEGGGDDDEEEIIDESDEAPRHKKQKTSKKPVEESDADADAEADLDDDEIVQAPHAEAGGNRRKRNIIEDEDDE